MSSGSAATLTRASEPSRACPPFTVSSSRLLTLLRLPRTAGVPSTTTLKTFCCSKKLPTVRPDSSVAASRRMSPGLTPFLVAAARLTARFSVGCPAGSCIRGGPSPPIRAMTASTCRPSRASSP